MARIQKDLSNAREELAFNHFVQNPTAKVREVQDKLMETHGFRMNLSRIYQLHRAARAGEGFPQKQSKAAVK